MKLQHVIAVLFTLQVAFCGDTAPTTQKEAKFARTLDLLLADDMLLPDSVTVSPATYKIILHNGYTNTPLDLRVDDNSSKAQVSSGHLTARASKANMIVELKSGQYVVYVAQRPRWRCVVTVADKKQ